MGFFTELKRMGMYIHKGTMTMTDAEKYLSEWLTEFSAYEIPRLESGSGFARKEHEPESIAEAERLHIPYTVSGDYTGHLAYESNRKVLMDEIGLPVCESVYGYGGADLYLDLTELAVWWDEADEDKQDAILAELGALTDAVDALTQYPVLDEGHYSELEWERREEAVADWALQDTVRIIETELSGPDTEAVVTEPGRGWISECLMGAGEYGVEWIVEQSSIWVDVDRMAKAILESSELTEPENGYLYRDRIESEDEEPPAGPEAFMDRVVWHNRLAQAERWRHLR